MICRSATPCSSSTWPARRRDGLPHCSSISAGDLALGSRSHRQLRALPSIRRPTVDNRPPLRPTPAHAHVYPTSRGVKTRSPAAAGCPDRPRKPTDLRADLRGRAARGVSASSLHQVSRGRVARCANAAEAVTLVASRNRAGTRPSPRARRLLCTTDMTIKKLAVLGSVLAGAALLQNKERRERLMRSATDFLHTTRDRLSRAGRTRTGEQYREALHRRTPSAVRTTVPSYSDRQAGQGRNGIYWPAVDRRGPRGASCLGAAHARSRLESARRGAKRVVEA